MALELPLKLSHPLQVRGSLQRLLGLGRGEPTLEVRSHGGALHEGGGVGEN